MKTQFLSTIIDVYSAPGNPDNWNNALKSINDLTGGKASAYVLINNQDGYAEFSNSYGYSEDLMSSYSGPGGAVEDDVRYKYLHNLLPGRVFRDMEYVESRDDWNSMPWNQFEREKMGIYYCMTAQISTHGVWSDYISVNRLEALGPSTDQEKQDLQLLLPHLARAAELHRVVAKLQDRYGAVLSVLNQFLIGLVILDSKGRVVTSNTAAREIGSTSGSYSLKNGRMKITNSDTNRLFNKICYETWVTAEQGGSSDGANLVVKNWSTDSNVLLEVMPIRDDGFSDRDNVRGTAIFVMDPSNTNVVSAQGLKEIFNLTLSESEVVNLLINGMSVSQIAEERTTHADTIRRQLKAAYAKTGTTGQLDLLRKAIKANPPIEQKTNK